MQQSEYVSQYIFNQEYYQNELFYLRKLIFEKLPTVKESIKWKIPFYDYQNRPLLFLNPKKHNLIIGFMDGVHLKDEENIFSTDSLSLKRIRHLYFPPILDEYDLENLSEEEIKFQNEEFEFFEQSFCKMLQKAAIFIENKNS
ncbi:DUF1801 domain-containing protein [Bernardetia sp. ABR2-2B]|uniref:DUF1801 domain-containing protein n=1 Tax=Bernardetia sp. ABR2-2B TaxID=3127472 RepID=UPI0030D41148